MLLLVCTNKFSIVLYTHTHKNIYIYESTRAETLSAIKANRYPSVDEDISGVNV
jgi:hypothetical protein